MAPLRFVRLAEVPAVTGVVSQWLRRNWFNRLERSETEIIESLRARSTPSGFPAAWVALRSSEPVATASMVDMPLPLDVRWARGSADSTATGLTGIYVAPKHRLQGVGGQLCRHMLEEARRLGLDTLDLITADRESFYRRLGWSTRCRTVIQAGERCTLGYYMECPLRP